VSDKNFKGQIFEKKNVGTRTETIMHIILKVSSRSCLFPWRNGCKFQLENGIKEESKNTRAYTLAMGCLHLCNADPLNENIRKQHLMSNDKPYN